VIDHIEVATEQQRAWGISMHLPKFIQELALETFINRSIDR